jgi:hypothetical protein
VADEEDAHERDETDPQVRLERWSRLLQGERVSELHALPEAQLIEKHDALVEEAAATKKPNPSAKLQWLERARVYTDELARREAVRQGERMEALTRSMNRLTKIVTIATIAGVIATIAGVIATIAGVLIAGWSLLDSLFWLVHSLLQ